jgi:fermentation-respiration switch protein FrsA (DUF1100 family)
VTLPTRQLVLVDLRQVVHGQIEQPQSAKARDIVGPVLRFLLFVLAAMVVLLGIVWLTQRGMMYFPSDDVGTPPQAGLPRAEAVTFKTADGLLLGGWFVPASEAGSTTVIVFNGNAGNRAYRADIASRLSEAGLAVLLFDYRGFGGNPGSPTEEGLAADAKAAHDYVLSRRDVDPSRIVYFGESLGSGVAVRLAVDHPPRALVLRSPFTSFVDLGRVHFGWLPVGLLLRDRYPSIDRIGAIRSPVLVIAGSNDSIVPVEQSRRLFEAARDPKRLVIVEGADHNDDALIAGPQVIGAVREFLASL